MADSLTSQALDQLFLEARTQNGWQDKPVDTAVLTRLYDLVKMGPTAVNSGPARFIFCTTPEARAKLAACAAGSNAAKILQAPVTVIIGMDLEFYTRLPQLFPHADVSGMFADNAANALDTAQRNSSLQGGYLILAARALGLDAGPMSGFDKAAVDAAFWGGTAVRTNFICSLGYGSGENLFARLPRLEFEDACQIL